MFEQAYTMPTEGPTQSGDEYFAHKCPGQWLPVPKESIGAEIDGALIRRPIRFEPSDVARELEETVKDLEKTVAGFGLRFARIRGAQVE